MSKPKQFSPDEAKRIGDSLGLDWDQVDLEQLRMGQDNRQRVKGECGRCC
jgi:hypothetical protein